MPTMKVYRSGIVQAPIQRGVEREAYATADEAKPEGVTGRTEAIFASPNLRGVTRWVRGNALAGSQDLKVRELTVDPATVMVYSVRAWERVDMSVRLGGGVQAYWATGMTLERWLTLDLDPTEWELLLTPEDIKGVRPVGAKRVADAANDYHGQEILKLLKR